jgi:predicted transcriptional regulator
MAVVTDKNMTVELDGDKDLRSALNRGIDDMEAGRELPLDEAMKKITELRESRRIKTI